MALLDESVQNTVQVIINSIDVTGKVIAYNRDQNICTGIANLSITMIDTGVHYDPWDVVILYEEGSKAGIFYVSSVMLVKNSGELQLVCQDGSKKLSDYFIDEEYTVGANSTTGEWIRKILGDVGVPYVITGGSGPPLAEGSTLGLQSAYDVIIQLVQFSTWYIYFNDNGVAIIGKMDAPSGNPLSLDDTKIASVKTIKHDHNLRNRAVVWGGTDFITGEWIYSDMSVITPWNYGSSDLRAIVFANSGIKAQVDADNMARMILSTFAKIDFEKEIQAIGLYNVTVGSYVFLSSIGHTGGGMITTLNVNVSDKGMITFMVLDERCPRLLAWWGDYDDYVYAGTAESGVWRKPLDEDAWEPFNDGLTSSSGIGIKDLYINDYIYAAVTVSGEAFIRSGYGYWDLFTPSGLLDGDSEVYYSGSPLATACTINHYENDILFGFNNASGDLTRRSWTVLVQPAGEQIVAYPINVSGDYNVKLHDLDTNDTINILTVDILGSGYYVLPPMSDFTPVNGQITRGMDANGLIEYDHMDKDAYTIGIADEDETVTIKLSLRDYEFWIAHGNTIVTIKNTQTHIKVSVWDDETSTFTTTGPFDITGALAWINFFGDSGGPITVAHAGGSLYNILGVRFDSSFNRLTYAIAQFNTEDESSDLIYYAQYTILSSNIDLGFGYVGDGCMAYFYMGFVDEKQKFDFVGASALTVSSEVIRRDIASFAWEDSNVSFLETSAGIHAYLAYNRMTDRNPIYIEVEVGVISYSYIKATNTINYSRDALYNGKYTLFDYGCYHDNIYDNGYSIGPVGAYTIKDFAVGRIVISKSFTVWPTLEEHYSTHVLKILFPAGNFSTVAFEDPAECADGGLDDIAGYAYGSPDDVVCAINADNTKFNYLGNDSKFITFDPVPHDHAITVDAGYTIIGAWLQSDFNDGAFYFLVKKDSDDVLQLWKYKGEEWVNKISLTTPYAGYARRFLMVLNKLVMWTDGEDFLAGIIEVGSTSTIGQIVPIYLALLDDGSGNFSIIKTLEDIYRIDISQGTPTVLFNIPSSGILEAASGYLPVYETFMNTSDDFYTITTNYPTYDARVIDFMIPSGIYLASGVADSEDGRYILFGTDDMIVGVPVSLSGGTIVIDNFSGAITQIEISNTLSEPYIFGSTITDSGEPIFYQRGPSNPFFTAQSTGLPNSEITVIRLDDRI